MSGKNKNEDLGPEFENLKAQVDDLSDQLLVLADILRTINEKLTSTHLLSENIGDAIRIITEDSLNAKTNLDDLLVRTGIAEEMADR